MATPTLSWANLTAFPTSLDTAKYLVVAHTLDFAFRLHSKT